MRSGTGSSPTERETSLGMTETCGPHTYTFDTNKVLPEHERGSHGPPMDRMEHKIVDRENARAAARRRDRRAVGAR